MYVILVCETERRLDHGKNHVIKYMDGLKREWSRGGWRKSRGRGGHELDGGLGGF